MKHSLLFLFLALGGSTIGFAQAYPLFNTSKNIDAGNIRAAHLVHGDMWNAPDSGIARCEFPKGSGKNAGFNCAIWLSGFDSSASPVAEHLSAAMYRSTGADFWPGPVLHDTSLANRYASSQHWARIWSVSSSDIQTFRSLTSHTAANTPTDIWEWPAKGNPYARGGGGSALNITTAMAPFVDVNSDGQYDPSGGDYPAIKGDQMLWWMINDFGPARDRQTALPMQAEIAISAYAYHRSSKLDNVIYYEYQITNRATVAYGLSRIGLMTDFDLGYPFDDFAGFDSSHRVGFNYNGKSIDGNGEPSSYGSVIPSAGLTLLEIPGDNVGNGSFVPAGSFVPFDGGGGSTFSDPRTPAQYDTLMRAAYHSGNWAHSNYGNWSMNTECTSHAQPGERRFTLASNDFHFAAGSTQKIAFALVVADSSGGCPNFDSTRIIALTDTAWKYYRNPPAVSLAVATFSQGGLDVYPNPAASQLFINFNSVKPGATFLLSDITGKVLRSMKLQSPLGKESVDIAALMPGIYFYRIFSAGGTLLKAGKLSKVE